MQHPFMIKTLNKVALKGTYLNIMKTICDKTRANILNGEKVKAFSLRSQIRQGCLLPPLLFNIVLGVLDTAIRQDKEIKRVHIWKEELTLSLLADNMMLNIENPIDVIKKLLKAINDLINFLYIENPIHVTKKTTKGHQRI